MAATTDSNPSLTLWYTIWSKADPSFRPSNLDSVAETPTKAGEFGFASARLK